MWSSAQTIAHFLTMTRLPVATRFALFYGAIFLALGVFLPFWPVWLADRGLSESQVGLLLALGLWAKVATGPLFGHLADRRRNRRGRWRIFKSTAARNARWPRRCTGKRPARSS